MKPAFALLLIAALHASAANIVERGPWAGALTPTSAVVKAKLTVPIETARLALSKSPDLGRAFYVPAERGDSPVAAFHVHNLQPNLYYYYAVEVSGVRDLQNRGR